MTGGCGHNAMRLQGGALEATWSSSLRSSASLKSKMERLRDRWSMDFPEGGEEDGVYEEKCEATDRLGDHAACCYRWFRRNLEELEEQKVDQELFGLLLTAESIRDEIRVFEDETSLLVRLAQTGYVVHQFQRLRNVLDSAAALYSIKPEDSSERTQWDVVLNEERQGRAAWYRRELERVRQGDISPILDEIDTVEKAEEAMTLLKAAVSKFGPDSDANAGEELTVEELSVITVAFDIVVEHSGMVIMTLPTWFVLPFEFGSTFGLSKWGIDRFIPAYKDEERFVREASGWSKINHPHVAKFLGACHVGDSLFVAHEEVRTMMEYASAEAKERKKVWGRIYEVSMALQYMNECGISCPNLTLDHLYCAKYEDRAVVLRGFSAISDFESGCQMDLHTCNQLARPSIEALVVTIVELFDCMTDAAEKCFPVHGIVKNGEARHTVASLLATKPPCLDDREWNQLKKLVENTDTELVHVIDTLGELAFIADRCDWLQYVPILDYQLQSTTNILEVAIMSQTIGQLLSKCREAIPATDKPLSNLLKRFEDIIFQLQCIHEDLSDWATLIKPIARLWELLFQFSVFTEQSAQTCVINRSWSASVSVSVSASANIGSSQQMVQECNPGRVRSMHSTLDQFLVLHQLSTSNVVHNWFREWKDVYLSTSSPPVKDNNIVVCDVANPLVSIASQVMAQWFIPREQIDFEQLNAFSEGAFGSIHKGKWFQTPVIVKRVKQHTTTETQFRQEADVWFQLNHINVVKMYGACDIGDLFFVCEYASGGDLDKYLDSKGRDPYLMWYCLLNAALGLQYLHNNGIVHADLKANNILVGGDGVAKLTDFGLSVRAKDPSGASAGALGAYQWKAPECLSGSVATFASDVYSFAMVMIEVMSGSCPWGNGTEDMLVKVQVKRGLLPPRPSNIGDSEWGLIERMCARDPSVRVTMDDVVVHLSSLLQKLDQDELWIDGVSRLKSFGNHVASRRGVLLSLVALTKSKNKSIVACAGDQIVSVAMSRETPSDRRELDAVLEMLFHGTTQQQGIAANAVGALSNKNIEYLTSPQIVSTLVSMSTEGASELKRQAVNALGSLSALRDISDLVVSARGIDLLIKLIQDGTDDQKIFGAVALSTMTTHTDTADLVHGIDTLVRLAYRGTGSQKAAASTVLANLTARIDINRSTFPNRDFDPMKNHGGDNRTGSAAMALANKLDPANSEESVLALCGFDSVVQLVRKGFNDQTMQTVRRLANLSIDADGGQSLMIPRSLEPLVQLMRRGNVDQKLAAVLILSNLSAHADISALVLDAHGIGPLVELVQNGTAYQKRFASQSLAYLSVDEDITEPVVASHGIEVLIQQVRDGSNEEQGYSACVLANLIARPKFQPSMLPGNTIDSMVQLVRDGTDSAKCTAAMVLTSLSARVEFSQRVFSAGSIDPLVQLLQNGIVKAKCAAIKVIANLSADMDISEALLAADGIEPLVMLLLHGTDEAKFDTTKVLLKLSGCVDISQSVLAVGGIDPLVRLVRDGQSDQKHAAAMILITLSLCTDISESVVAAGGINALVELLRGDSETQTKLAAMLFTTLSARADISVPLIAAQGIGPLVALIRLGNDDQKLEATRALVNISGHADVNELLVNENGIEPLVNLVRDGTNEQKDTAVMALENLTLRGDISEAVLGANGIKPLVQILGADNAKSKKSAAMALAVLSYCPETRQVIIAAASSFNPLVTLLRSGSNKEKYAIATMLANLSASEDISESIRNARGIESLVCLVRDGTDDQKNQALLALGNLSSQAGGCESVLAANGVTALIQLVRSDNFHQMMTATAILVVLAANPSTKDSIVASGELDQLLQIVRDGTDEQKKCAVIALSRFFARTKPRTCSCCVIL